MLFFVFIIVLVLGIYYPNIFDQFEFIEYKVENK